MKLNVNKNDLLITFITTVIVILIMLLIVFTMFNKKSKNEINNTEPRTDYYNEYQQQRATEGVTADDAVASLVNSANNYYTVKAIIDKFNTYVSYLNSSASDLGLIVSKQEEKKALEEYKQDGLKYINDVLANNYKTKYSVNNDYIYNNLKNFAGVKYKIDKMYIVEDSKYINTYFVYGKYSNIDFNFIVILDRYNYTFEIYLNNYFKDGGYNSEELSTMKTLHIEKIEKNESNTFQFKNINQQALANTYYDDFFYEKKKNPELAYSKLDSDYKNSKFKTLDDFKKYIQMYTNANKRLGKYKMIKYDSYTELICQDTFGAVWIFKIKGVMNCTILLDSYTIPVKEYEDEYQNAKEEKKAQLCLNRFFEALNNQDYEVAYKFFNDTYKENNFKTLDDFKSYVQNNWFTYNLLDYSGAEYDNNYYIISGTISDFQNEGSYTAKHIKKNFTIKLGNGITDFEMSFEK